jgi:hypothetical protein
MCSPQLRLADWLYLAGFLVANLALRLWLININQGEYTDGILQLTVFENKAGLYPPLYGALAFWLEPYFGSREFAGRIVSAVAGTLALIPIYLFTVRLARPCAARFSALLFTLCPLILRWSLHVMTDTLFLTLSALSLLALLKVYEEKRAPEKADRYLALASLLAALSALTRYQGAFLAILVAVESLIFLTRRRRIPWRTLVSSLVWLALPAWIFLHGFVHQTQFAQRSSGQWVATLLAWLNLAESFLLIFPYYLGWPIFLFGVVGIMRVDWRVGSRRHFLLLWSLWGGMLLILQSIFGSFQYRYLMPIFPAAIAVAGAGASYLEDKWAAQGRPWLFTAVLSLALAYLVVFSSAVLIFQRQSFGDQRAAADFVRQRIPKEAMVLSNERYGNFLSLGCVKLSYWSKRPVHSVFEFLPQRPEQPLPKIIPPGSYVIIGNAYGGDEMADYLAAILTYYYHMRYAASFDTTVYPLMDDIMVNPMFNQNPLGWVLRYSPQLFSTHLYVVDGLRTQEEFDDLKRRRLPIPADPTQSPRARSGRVQNLVETTSTQTSQQ